MDKIEYIDNFLASCEDFLHGEESKECTQSRYYLIDIKEELQKLPKVCTGCGQLSNKKISSNYLSCCPDNNYIPLEDYLKNSKYIEKEPGPLKKSGIPF